MPLSEAMEVLSHLVNPWQIPAPLLCAIVVANHVITRGLDHAVAWLGNRFIAPMPSRRGPRPPPSRGLEYKDWLFLAINAVVETAYMGHLIHYLFYSPNIDRSVGGLGFLNGPVALYLTVVFNDMFYAPMHRILHTPLLYRWIHKHHHSSSFPDRGSLDALNEHPVEAILAMIFWFLALQLVTLCVGMHFVVIPIHTGMMAIGAIFNHTAHDLSFSCFGMGFSVRAHEMHHRMPKKNFGLFCMWFDKLMGTYTPYLEADDK